MNYPNLEELACQLESQTSRDRLLVGRVGIAHHVSGTFRGGRCRSHENISGKFSLA